MTRRAGKKAPQTATTPPPQVKRLLAVLLAMPLLIGVVFWIRSGQKTPIEANPRDDERAKSPTDGFDPARFPIPSVTPTRFRNASSEVAYVGNQACVDCHPTEHQTYRHTNHSRSLEPIEVAHEPPDGEFFHELSGRHYRIYRQDGALRLQESIRDDDGKQVVLEDHEAKYALGSGNHARLYFSQVEDYLVESPMTWYPHQQVWGMSAGYEKDPHQPGFTREVGWGCLYCHAGGVNRIDQSSMRLQITERAISCERCHGPGALHVKERQEGLPIHDGLDDSIVNLRHLSRETKEDICSQCHLSTAADVMVRTRKLEDFRPGMKMSDFRISYRLDRTAARTVSGQILQMRQSPCYIESETMTCATCHDPHADLEQSVRVEQYRAVCLNCHDQESCQTSMLQRHATQPPDNCISCHMPKGPTDIPHFSFTHHKIGIHAPSSEKERLTRANQLVPVTDISHLPELEQQRLLGLANDSFAGKLADGLDDERRDDPHYTQLSEVFRARGQKILEDVYARGLRDATVEEFFSRRAWRNDPERCIEHGLAALKDPRISADTKDSVLFNLASTYFDLGQHQSAMPLLEQLVEREREDINLMLLGICHQKQGALVETERLVKQAIVANPARADLHVFLSSVYRQMGRLDESERHQRRGELLQRRVPQPR